MNTLTIAAPHNQRIDVRTMLEDPTGRPITTISFDGCRELRIEGCRVGIDLTVSAPELVPETGTYRMVDVSKWMRLGMTHEDAVAWWVGACENGIAREAGYAAVAA